MESTLKDAAVAASFDVTLHAPPQAADLHRQSEATVIQQPKALPCLARNSMYSIGGYAAGQVLRLAGNILVSRLVFPEAFGLMAIVNILIQGLTMFSDVGIEPVLVQNRRGDEPRFYNTAWSVQVIRGWLLFIFAALSAIPAAHLYGEPRLLYLLPLAAAATVLSGFNSTALYAVRRHLQIGRLTLLDLAAQTTGVVVMCGWAWFQPSVMAMVAGLIASSLVTLVGSHFLIPGYRNGFAWDRSAFAELLHFGKWVFVSTMITFCAMQIDRLMLGRLISLDELGVYSVALAIALLPSMLLQTVSGTVLYPLLSRVVRSSPKTLSTQLDEARRVFFAFGTFCVTGVILEAETFFTLLYDDRYSAAGEIACWLTLGVWVTIVSNTLERTLQALGDSRSLAWFSFVKVVCSVSVAYVGFNLAGLPGFIIGMAVGAVGGHFVLWRRLAEHGVSAWQTDLRVTAFTTVAIAIGLALTTVASTLQGALLREVVAWTYLAALATWSASRLRQLRNIGVRVGECP